jgi:hypothetical protein
MMPTLTFGRDESNVMPFAFNRSYILLIAFKVMVKMVRAASLVHLRKSLLL